MSETATRPLLGAHLLPTYECSAFNVGALVTTLKALEKEVTP